jgi:acetyl-CoA carboxylase biotin carboxylase subunit
VFKRILIANRGEIALRVIRACRELGIETVAVYSTADESALHVRFADQAVCIGPPPALQSYLHQPALLSAAQICEVDAVHPGYGFLAENAQFASAVRSMGMAFVGPGANHLTVFGDKLAAKAAARAAGLPMVPGSEGAVHTLDEALKAAEGAGYPVMLKAAAGGGGKGMRVVVDADTLGRVFEVARAEAQSAFGNGALFIERYLDTPRHVEVQVAGDAHGNAVHLFTRDCSLQRRHQKIIEEAPAPGLDDVLHRRIAESAALLARSVGYQTVGTVEFLLEEDEFFFLEVNPRIQVEHPVTEEVTGIDLVQEQIRLSAGEPLSFSQQEVRCTGHAIEARVNAEDPWTFLPSPGRVTGYHEPGGHGVRVDSAIHEQALIQPFYDSLVGKLIVHGRDREEAIRRMLWAIDEFVVEGVGTLLPMQRALIGSADFRDIAFHTRYVDAWVKERKQSG